ncbi:MAG: PKD domain-containing protein [Chitinophagales bacterium]
MKPNFTRHLAALTISLFCIFCSFEIQAQITGDSTICIGTSSSYTTSLTGNITWTISPTGPALNAAGNTVSINWTLVGIYTLTADNGTTTETFNINAYSIPEPLIQYAKNPCSIKPDDGGVGGSDLVCDTFCVDEIVNYFVINTPGSTYNWTIFGGTIISGLGTNSVMVQWNTTGGTGAGECGSLCVEETNAAGCTNTKPACVHGVSAYPNGTVSIGSNSAIVGGVINACLNEVITFINNSTGPFTSYTWDFGDGNYTTTLGATNVTNSYSLPGTYTVILTASTDCCSNTDTITVVVGDLPGPDIFCITPVCSNEPEVQYCTSVTGCTYTWVVTGGTIISGLGTSCITVDWGAGPVGTIALTVSGCSPAVCASTTTVSVPIMPNGNFNILGPLVVCVGATEMYNAPYVPGSQYTWTLIDPSSTTTILPYNTPPYIQSVTFNTPGNYTLICNMVNDILDCEGADTIKIKVRPSLDIFGPTSVCENSPPTFFSSAYNCNWVTTSPGNSPQSGTSASFVFNTVGTYTVTANTIPAGAVCNNPQTITVVVKPTPVTPIITGPIIVCPQGTYNYSTSGYSASATYNWYFIDVLFNTAFGNGNPFSLTLPAGFTSGTLTLTVTENGCSASSILNLNAPAIPAPTFTGNQTVCPDQNEIYTAILSYPGLSNVVWTITPPSAGTIISGQGTATPTIEWHSVIPNAPQNVTLTVTETTCLSLTGTYSLPITIYALPVITASAAPFCPGSNTVLTATGGTGYSWFNAANNPLGGPTATVSLPGNYYVIGTDANGCTAKDYINVIAFSSPSTTISQSNISVCDTNGVLLDTVNLVALNGPGGYNYVWSPSGDTTSSISATSTGTYSVIVTDNNGCKDTAYYIVACPEVDSCELPTNCACVNNTPTATQGNPNCNIYNFSANSTCSGTPFWYFGDLTGGSGNSVSHTYATASYYTVCYENSDPGCCPPPPACTVIVVPVAADFDYNIICNTVSVSDYSTYLPGYNITGYFWDFGDGFTTTSATPGPHTYLLPGTYTITLTVYTAAGCQAISTQTFILNGPAISATIVPTGCNGPVNFSAITLGGPIVDWSWDFGDTYGSNIQNPQHIFNATGSYIVTVTGTDANGCTVTVFDTINIVTPPPAFNLIYATPSCGPTLITIPGAGAYTLFQWYNNGTIIPGATSNSYLAVQSGNYTVEVTDINGCVITSNIAPVIINPTPIIALTASPNPLCSNDPVTINSNLNGFYTLNWIVDGNPAFGGNSLILNSLSPGSHTISLTAIDNATGCNDSASITINVNASPFVYITNSDPSGICSGDSIQLTANSATAISYLWSNGYTYNPVFIKSSGTNSVTVTDALGCTASASSLVTIHPLPDLSMLPIGCDSACINPVPNIITGPPNMLSYDWQINNVTVATTQNLSLSPLNMPVYGIPYTVSLIATTLNGCVDSTDFEYTPLNCDSSCFDLEDTIYCNEDGTFTIELLVTNNSTATSTFLWLHDVTTPFTLTPNYIVPLTLLQGQTSAPIFITVSYPSGPLPSDICFKASLYNTDSCCHDTTLYCIPVPDCNPCSNISVSTDSTEECCKSISITNNYFSNYFSGIQIVPITPGASIGSAQVGFPYLGTWTGMGNSSQMTFTPNAGYIPTGNIASLVDICLNLAPATPSPQMVLVNWLVPGAMEGDSIVCVDTLLFYCTSPLENTCGEIIGDIICNADGTYSYNYTFTNNSTQAVTMLVFTSVTPYVNIIPNPILPASPILPAGTYSGTVIIDPGIYLPGTTICFDLTLADSTGWCCHTMDSICITLPECNSCECGDWTTFSFDSFDAINGDVNCGDSLDFEVGNTIVFYAGGYTCIGDSLCTSAITWTMNGPVSGSGTGYPTFNFSVAGSYTLTLYGECGGNICDSCIIYFEIADEECECGTWTPFNLTDESGGGIDTYDVECGGTYSGIETFGYISFNSGGINCIGDPVICDALTTWNVNGPITASGTGLPSFATTTSGTYVLTIYGYCGGNLCDSCIITFVVEESRCECGNWETFGAIVDVPGDFDYSIVSECGDTLPTFQIGTNINFVAGGYLCIGDPAVCGSDLEWSLTGPVTSSGSGLPTFTFSTPGTYTLTFTGSCNGNECGTCIITFVVEDAPICDCGSWGLFTVSNATKTMYGQSCGTSYNWKINSPITINGTYTCYGECAATYSWIVKRNGTTVTTGYGLPVTYTPTANGNYEVFIYPVCGGFECEPCSFRFKIRTKTSPKLNEGIDARMSMTLAPNPANNYVKVTLESVYNENGLLTISNELGEMVKSESVELFEGINTFNIEIQNLPSGIYFVKYTGNSEITVERLIKTN